MFPPLCANTAATTMFVTGYNVVTALYVGCMLHCTFWLLNFVYSPQGTKIVIPLYICLTVMWMYMQNKIRIIYDLNKMIQNQSFMKGVKP